MLTPAHHAELEDVGPHVRVEDLDEGEVHVQSLQPHPGEGRQQEIVHEQGGQDAQAVAGEGRQPGVEQVQQVQGQQGGR